MFSRNFSRTEYVVLVCVCFELVLILLFLYPYLTKDWLIEASPSKKPVTKDNRVSNSSEFRIRREMVGEEDKISWWKKEFSNATDISKPLKKESIFLLLIVTTAPQRFDRRDGIRQTWWRSCLKSNRVKCVFFTDGDLHDEYTKDRLIEENRLYNDIYVQPLSGGVQFGERFLYQLRWGVLAYEFEYFMRLDDDMFLCFDRLLNDLEIMPKVNLIWSWIHCKTNLVRPEESFLVISRDVTRKFVTQNPKTMKCHPLADQQIGVWVDELRLKDVYYHDARIHHDPPASTLPEMRQRNALCSDYVAIHGSYPDEMKHFWRNKGEEASNPNLVPKPLKTYCGLEPVLKWGEFGEPWIFEPKPCSEKPVWDTTKLLDEKEKFYGGRQNKLASNELAQKSSELTQCKEQYAKLSRKYHELLRQT